MSTLNIEEILNYASNGEIAYDFHIHSCLSPCGDIDMTPENIVNMSILNGKNVIALTDHNSVLNCKPTMEVVGEQGLVCIAGMELTVSEEAHIICLFETLEGALEFGRYVYNHLPDIKNAPLIYGEQLIVDRQGEICGSVDKLLINATTISVEELSELLKKYGGVAFPSHIDRESNSLFSALGVIPAEYGFTHIELSKNFSENSFIAKCGYINEVKDNYKILQNSDAHRLEELG